MSLKNELIPFYKDLAHGLYRIEGNTLHFSCCHTVPGLHSELLSILHSQNILKDVRCGPYTSNTDKQFIWHIIVHPGQHYGLSILVASANCTTHFWTLGALGMHVMPMDMGFQVHSKNENSVFVKPDRFSLLHKRSVHKQYSIALYINKHVYLAESTSI